MAKMLNHRLPIAAAMMIIAAVLVALVLASQAPVSESEARYQWAILEDAPLERDSITGAARGALQSLRAAFDRAPHTRSLLYPLALDAWSQLAGESVAALRGLSLLLMGVGLIAVYDGLRQSRDARLTLIVLAAVAIVCALLPTLRAAEPYALIFMLTALAMRALTAYTARPSAIYAVLMALPLMLLAWTSDVVIIVWMVLAAAAAYAAVRERGVRWMMFIPLALTVLMYAVWWSLRAPAVDDGLTDNALILLPIGAAVLGFFALPRGTVYESLVGLGLALFLLVPPPVTDWTPTIDDIIARRDPREVALIAFEPQTLAAHYDRTRSFTRGVAVNVAWDGLDDAALETVMARVEASEGEGVWLMGYGDSARMLQLRAALEESGCIAFETTVIDSMQFARCER